MVGQELEVQQKKELTPQQEKTIPARFYRGCYCNIENEVLSVEGRIETAKYNRLDPLYTEYPIGHFARSFALPEQIDQHNITAQLEDGVLTLTLNKRPESKLRRIAIL